jgi:hypothetical protein
MNYAQEKTKMIKKQQKWIALLVTLTFMGLLQVSTMPVAAANAPEQIASANAEQAPSFIEEEGDSSSPAKKKSILPVILIGVGVAAVAAVLFLVVLKTNYDIRGTWSVTATWIGHAQQPAFTLVFTGNKESGTFKEGIITGTYTADGKNVTWKYNIFPISAAGKFSGKDSMTGTLTASIPGYTSGTFTATRTAAAVGTGNSDPCGTAMKIK